MYTIYCHIFPNGKRYIGLTKTSVERRWGNGHGYATCILVNRAISKYGWENVKHLILDTAETKEEAEEKERKYIFEYDTTNSEKGYNILPGGDVSDNSATEEMRYKLGNGQRGKKRTTREKKKISGGVKKAFSRPESNGHFGMKASDETKFKMSQSQKKTWNDERRKNASDRMRIRMSDSSFRESTLNRLSEYRGCNKGRHWSEEIKRKISESSKGVQSGGKNPMAKAVLQYSKNGDFIKRWECAKDAERAGIARSSSIDRCCNNVPHYKTAGGFVWKFA